MTLEKIKKEYNISINYHNLKTPSKKELCEYLEDLDIERIVTKGRILNFTNCTDHPYNYKVINRKGNNILLSVVS